MSGATQAVSVLLIAEKPSDRRDGVLALVGAGKAAGVATSAASAASMTEALAQLDRETVPPDAIVLDLAARGGDLADLRYLREAHPLIPIVAIIESGDLAAATTILRNGADDCLDRIASGERGLFRAVSFAIERKKGETELLRQARTDPLTGLLNRRAFFEQLELSIAQARRSELACAVMVFDVDKFKEINDVFGHKTGDEVLMEVSRRLKSQLRESDWIARIGGDEFAVLATNLRSASAAMEIAEKIVRAIDTIEQINDMHVDVSISIGISVFPMDDVSGEVLISHADLAMYKSKGSKKGSINFFDTRMDAVVKARHALKRSMPEDIDAGRFYLLFQPIVNAVSREIISAEGLARWRDPDNKIISPGDFIPIAEESGSIGNLGSRLLEQACLQIKSWGEMQKALIPISLNMSPIQVRDPAFGERLIEMMETTGVAPSLINIEITESTIFKNLDVIQKNLEMVKNYGVGVYIDDFGTGYSSLSLLKDLPLTALKIDRSFVREIGREAGPGLIVQAVVDLARKLGFQTIAEGVETEEQAIHLRDMGVNGLQGYYFSKPVPGAQLAGWLARSESYLVA